MCRLRPIPARSSRCDASRTRAPLLCRRYPASSLVWAPPTSALATTTCGGVPLGGTPGQISRVALCGVCTCCAQYPGGHVHALRFSDLNTTGLRRYQGGSTPALLLSRPVQASLALRPVHLLTDQPCRPLSLGLRRRSHPLRRPGSYPGKPTIPGVGLAPTVTQHLCAALLIIF